MKPLEKKTIIVAGGTGNVGSFIVRSLLEGGATVAVPSRSADKIEDMKRHLSGNLGSSDLRRLHTFVGDLSDESSGSSVVNEIVRRLGTPHGAISTLGRWNSVPSLLSASKADFEPVLDGYLFSHLMTARSLIPAIQKPGGVFIFINGPLAFEPWGPQSALVSIVTAAQHMLFRSLAKELEEEPLNLIEVVSYAYIRNRQTQPGSRLSGEDVGQFVSEVVARGADNDHHGRSIHLRSREQIQLLTEA